MPNHRYNLRSKKKVKGITERQMEYTIHPGMKYDPEIDIDLPDLEPCYPPCSIRKRNDDDDESEDEVSSSETVLDIEDRFGHSFRLRYRKRNYIY